MGRMVEAKMGRYTMTGRRAWHALWIPSTQKVMREGYCLSSRALATPNDVSCIH
jgi:hypothetical protein